jgi:hypothetical protein
MTPTEKLDKIIEHALATSVSERYVPHRLRNVERVRPAVQGGVTT